MKRILVVLLLLAVASLGFSVTGSVYARMVNSGGSGGSGAGYYDNETWATTLQDLRVGRQGTGVTLNFDSFSLSYKIRRAISANDGLSVVTGNSGITRNATSPGYLRIDGLKLGTVDLGIGASWWTLGETQNKFDTNAGGSTNVNSLASVGYNNVAFDLTYNIPVGDSLRIHADPWNKTFFNIYGGSSSVTTPTSTNTGSVGGYNATISCNIDYSMEAFSLTVEAKAFLSGQNASDIRTANTNNVNTSSSEIGAVAKLGYVVNELVSVFGDIGLVVYGGSSVDANTANRPITLFGANGNVIVTNNMTNTLTTSGMQVPILVGITLSPASAFQVNLGIGYALMLNNQVQQVVSTAGFAATNVVVTDPRFQSQWDNYEMHGYHHPLIKFGADTKFAGDFSAGLRFIVQLNENGGAGNNNGNLDQNSHDNFGFNKQGDWLNFATAPDWDAYGGSSAYLGYDKDNFSTKLWVAGVNPAGLLGLFGAIDVGIKF